MRLIVTEGSTTIKIYPEGPVDVSALRWLIEQQQERKLEFNLIGDRLYKVKPEELPTITDQKTGLPASGTPWLEIGLGQFHPRQFHPKEARS